LPRQGNFTVFSHTSQNNRRYNEAVQVRASEFRKMSDSAIYRYAIGSDHAGFPLKQELVKQFQQKHIIVVDCGTTGPESCDYPDFARAAALEMIAGRADRAILLCGSGVGISVAANKFPGIRAAVCHDTYSARQGVEHDDMNTLCLGARVIGPELAFEIVRAFVAARYTKNDRYARRLDKVKDIERRALEGEYSKRGF
jgi:ribose 5-phosphate isomerase B